MMYLHMGIYKKKKMEYVYLCFGTFDYESKICFLDKYVGIMPLLIKIILKITKYLSCCDLK